MEASDTIFRVRVNLVPRELGGPPAGIKSGYQARVWLGDFAEDRGRVTCDAELRWEGVDEVAAGATAIGRLLPAVDDEWSSVDTGSRLEFYEGPHVVGRALVVEVLEPSDS